MTLLPQTTGWWIALCILSGVAGYSVGAWREARRARIEFEDFARRHGVGPRRGGQDG